MVKCKCGEEFEDQDGFNLEALLKHMRSTKSAYVCAEVDDVDLAREKWFEEHGIVEE